LRTYLERLIYIEEARLQVVDILSMVLAFQFFGSVDVLSMPSVWDNGSFVQPFDLSPDGVSTLSTLVLIENLMSIAWVLSSIRHYVYTFGKVADDLTTVRCSFTIF